MVLHTRGVTFASFFTRALTLSALTFSGLGLALGCSASSDFVVGGEDTGGTGSDADTDSGSPGDATPDAPDPCADEAGKAKFCLTVTAETGPGYAGDVAAKMGLDGKGLLRVYLYDKDPATATKEAPILPVATLRYGAIGEKIGIEKLPVKIVDSVAKAGTYWVIGSFADADRPEADGTARAGDFLSQPTSYDTKGKPSWLKLEVTAGKTTKETLKLYPMRRLDLELRIAAPVVDAIKAGKVQANGDGPVLVMVYDGVLGGAGEKVHFGDLIPCVATNPKVGLTPSPVYTSVLTPVTGAHNVFAGLVDFPGDGFPNRGTFLPDLSGATVPTVDIKSSEWAASTTVRFTTIYDGYAPADPVVDTLVCK